MTESKQEARLPEKVDAACPCALETKCGCGIEDACCRCANPSGKAFHVLNAMDEKHGGRVVDCRWIGHTLIRAALDEARDEALEVAGKVAESVTMADWVNTPRTKGGSTFMEPAAKELLLECAAAIRALKSKRDAHS